MTHPQTALPDDRLVEVAELAESHAALRLLDGEAVRAMRESLLRHGQLAAVSAYRPREAPRGLEVVDGFKRLRAARELGWSGLRVRVLPVGAAEAKAAVWVLNRGRGLSELEEAWLVRSLYREDGLKQPEIGRLLGRHKSWVCRRLLLAEGLDEAVQVDVRLGLLSASAAAALARLPRCNQKQAAAAAMARGLTRHQVERVVQAVLSRPASDPTKPLDDLLAAMPELAGPASGRRHGTERTPAQWILADVAQVTRICARLQGRLLSRPLVTLGDEAARLVTEGLAGLLPVLDALHRTLAKTTSRQTQGDRHASLDDAHRA